MRYAVFDFEEPPDTEEIASFDSLSEAKRFITEDLIAEGYPGAPFVQDTEDDTFYVPHGRSWEVVGGRRGGW